MAAPTGNRMNSRHLSITLLAWLLVGCDSFDCEGDSAEAAAMRALDRDRLQQLALDIDALWSARSDSEKHRVFRSRDNMPVEFKKLGIRMLRIHSDRATLRLKGCFDHHLDLAVSRDEVGVSQVALMYGEGPCTEKEILWVRETNDGR